MGALDSKRSPSFAHTSLDSLLVERLPPDSVEMLRFAQHDNRSENTLAQNEQPFAALLIETSGIFYAAEHWDLDWRSVFDDSFAQSRRVIVKRQAVTFLVIAEFVQTIRI